MSATLTARQLAAGHGNVELFSGLDLVVAPGDVIGLVGVNGAGKSTLLRMLAGLDRPEQGTVTLSPPTATVGYLPQEPDAPAGETVRDFLARRTGVAAAQHALDAAAEALERGERGADDAYAVALERWLGLGGADLDERAAAVAAELGLAVDLDQPMTALSGGQAARAGLASLLLRRYDVFLLDEPTNDLDLDGLARLEGFVPACGPAPCWSATTASSCTAPSTGCSSWTWRSSRSATTAAATPATWTSGRSPAGTPARSTRSTPTPGPAWRRAPGRSAPGWRRACGTPAGRASEPERQDPRGSGPSRARSRRPRPGRPSG